jgi:hypothetical protein
MENYMDVAMVGGKRGLIRLTRARVATVALVMLVAAATLLLLQQRVEAQVINIQAIVCPILQQIRNAFADSPFFGFIEPIINRLLQLFGCAPSP